MSWSRRWSVGALTGDLATVCKAAMAASVRGYIVSAESGRVFRFATKHTGERCLRGGEWDIRLRSSWLA